MTAFLFKVKQNVDALKIRIIFHSLINLIIYQQIIVFIECSQVAVDGDSVLIDDVTFVSILKKQLVPTTTKVWSNDQRQ
jgi:hypothetical protein